MIRIEGLSLERLINLAANEGVRLIWAQRSSYTVLEAAVTARGWKRLRKLDLSRYHIQAVRKVGVPFFWQRLRMYPALLAGVCILACAVFALSRFVWDVRVTGLDIKEKWAFEKELASLGVCAGASYASIDLEAVEIELMVRHDEFAWIDLKRRGVTVLAEVVTALPVPEIADENTPCHIVAGKDAYIQSLMPLCGEPLVRTGQTVRKGDVLISGLIWDEGTQRMMVAARGEVIGSVWYTGTASAPLFEQTRKPTGRTQQTREISIGRDSVLMGDACRFEDYDTRLVQRSYIGDRLFLPVCVSVYEHSEIEIVQTPVVLEVLQTTLEEQAYRNAEAKMQADVETAGHQAFFEIDEETLTVTIYLQTYEDIGEIEYLGTQ